MTYRKPKEKMQVVFFIALLFSSALQGGLLLAIVHAQSLAPLISVTPPYVSVISFERFNVTITLTDVTDLYAWQTMLLFDAAILNATNAWAKPYVSHNVFDGKSSSNPMPVINNTAGYVLCGDSLYGAQPTFSGSGVLCQIEFQPKTLGPASLRLSRPLEGEGSKTFLLDNNLNFIRLDVADGPLLAKFRIGDRVQTTANLRVREGPGLSYNETNIMPEGTLGEILGGPVEADGFVWWEVDYDGGVRGWSAQNWLELAVLNQRPSKPTDVAQYMSDAVTVIPEGDRTPFSTVVFKGVVSDPDGDRVRLQVELRNLNEYSGEFNEAAGEFKASEPVSSGGEAVAFANELIDESYHWRARTIDEHELTSDWMEFGVVGNIDFTVSLPNSPPNIDDFSMEPDSAISLPGIISDHTNMRFPRDVDLSWECWDPDGDSVTYDVYFGTSEVPPLVSSDQTATTYDPGLLSYGTTYHWSVVAEDSHGATDASPIEGFITVSGPGPVIESWPEVQIVIARAVYIYDYGEHESHLIVNIEEELLIRNVGEGTLDWSVESDADWLFIDPSTRHGTSTGEWDTVVMSLEVGVVAHMNAGDEGSILISAPHATKVRVKVYLEIIHLVVPEGGGPLILTFECPVNVTMTDQYSRVISDNGTNQIPNATFASTNETKYFCLPLDLTYNVSISAYDMGNFTLRIVRPTVDNTASMDVYENVSVKPGTQATLEVIPYQMNQTMKIDNDGDGVIDECVHALSVTAQLYLPGDLNMDGKVDIIDVAVASSAFGSYLGHQRWKSIADQNGDNRVDIRDIAIVCSNYGKTYM